MFNQYMFNQYMVYNIDLIFQRMSQIKLGLLWSTFSYV